VFQEKSAGGGAGKNKETVKKEDSKNLHIHHDHGDKHFHDKYHAFKPIIMKESKYDHIGEELLHELQDEKKKKNEHPHPPLHHQTGAIH
jgi:hypothetical protein